MNILMLTNTYTPHVGGVARSVEAFAAHFRRMGHRVIIIAPQFENAPVEESDVIRIPAIQKFNGSDFSVRIPIPGLVSNALKDFAPDIVHAHHPFLLGDTAVRIAASWNRPLVFTHHTMYERYTHYVPGDSPTMARFVKRLTTGYANLCDRVIAPSESVAAILRQRGVVTPLEVVPTGVEVEQFAQGDGAEFRRALGIPLDAYVVGHVGRLAPEKNLGFLAQAVAAVMKRCRHVHFVVIGSGPSAEEIRQLFERAHMENRLYLAGPRSGAALADAYHAMDLFAFASQSETQGMVLTEAMSAGLPVVALDGPGVREVVVDGENGRLLRRQSVRRFAAAVTSIMAASPSDRQALSDAARRTAESFAMPHCAARAVRIYEALLKTQPRVKHPEDSVWESTFRLVESEWELWSNLARSARGALRPRPRWRRFRLGRPRLGTLVRAWRRLNRWLNVDEWGIRLLRLSTSEDTATEPGLVLVQIDGLSRTQFERALARGRLPFLRRLIKKEGHQVHDFYSGLPSSTPAVQGELFYGVATAVPAFSFREAKSNRIVRMYESSASAEVQSQLATMGAGLLEGGSAYSDIYTGGAAEAHFCSSALGWGDVLRNANPLASSVFVLAHFVSLLRTAALMLLECFLAIVDLCRGLLTQRHLVKELKFVPSRVAVSILLRELVTIGATMDVTRGLPIIHVNYLGYDEQAHRRGPSSLFAHWSLKGIDGCIRRIWRAARRSRRRDYQVWVYADHGQERTQCYVDQTGRALEDVVAEVFHTPVSEAAKSKATTGRGIEAERSAWLGGRVLPRLLGQQGKPAITGHSRQWLVAAMGPLAHLYAPDELSGEQRLGFAARLVREAQLPLVFTFDGQGVLWAFEPRGCFRIPEQAAEVLGGDHPFLRDVGQDLVRLCGHPAAGELVVSGWKQRGVSLSFPKENGAHAGPGIEETRSFALLPSGACLPRHAHSYLRPRDLRAAVLHALGRDLLSAVHRVCHHRAQPQTVRIMTYNVHSCIGVDGRLSPSRIARLIAQYEPDIVALQELDVCRPRTYEVDQAHAIARELEMEYQFHPAIQMQEERYGDAILSPHPMQLIRAGRLPGLVEEPHREPRGALWVEVDVDGRKIHVLNTHLGLARRERMAQIEALLGPDWLGNPRRRDPFILCGDLNAMPGSRGYRRLAVHLRDVQLCVANHRPQRTWAAHYPLTRIDHMFVGANIEVVRVEVPRTDLACRASDHLPLVVDLRILKGMDSAHGATSSTAASAEW